MNEFKSEWVLNARQVSYLMQFDTNDFDDPHGVVRQGRREYDEENIDIYLNVGDGHGN